MKKRILVNKGPHAGEIHDCVSLFNRLTPDDTEPDWSKGEGIWIDALNLRIAAERPWSFTTGDNTVNYGSYTDTVVPFDKYEKEIFVGDELYASVKTEVRRVKVVKLTTVNCAGYGLFFRKLLCVDVDSGQKLTITTPKHCVKV